MFSLVGLLDTTLRKMHNSEEQSTEYFRASDLGKCKLMRYWKRMGVEGDRIDERGLRVFAVGHLFHDFIQDITKREGFSVLQETDLQMLDKSGNILLTGHADDLIYDKEEDEYILLDYKTVHSRKFHYLGKEKDTHYEKQVTAYKMMISEKHPEYADKIKSIRIVYISKDDLCLREVAVIDSTLEDQVWAEVNEMNKAFETKTEPKPVPEMDWECGYCAFQSKCPRGKDLLKGDAQREYKSEQKKTIKL